MTKAIMCMKLDAPWKMMVLASSIFRAKQSVSTPTPLETEVMGPTDGHNGKGAVWHMSVKSPKPPILSATTSDLLNIYSAQIYARGEKRRGITNDVGEIYGSRYYWTGLRCADDLTEPRR